MSTPVKAPAAEAIGRAWQALHAVLCDGTWGCLPEADRKAVRRLLAEVVSWIELYDAVLNGVLHWANACPAEWQDMWDYASPRDRALDRFAGEAAHAADRLTDAVVKCCGEETAAPQRLAGSPA